MASNNDSNSGAPAASSGPFVVSHPCNGCHGQGDISGQPCPACRGTGAERFFHGTKIDLKTGDLIKPGHRANFGNRDGTTTYVYLTATLDAATWGAELALGEGRGNFLVPHVARCGVPTVVYWPSRCPFRMRFRGCSRDRVSALRGRSTILAT